MKGTETASVGREIAVVLVDGYELVISEVPDSYDHYYEDPDSTLSFIGSTFEEIIEKATELVAMLFHKRLQAELKEVKYIEYEGKRLVLGSTGTVSGRGNLLFDAILCTEKYKQARIKIEEKEKLEKERASNEAFEELRKKELEEYERLREKFEGRISLQE